VRVREALPRINCTLGCGLLSFRGANTLENENGQARVEYTPEEIESRIHALDGRDLQLWLIGAVVLVFLAGGFLAIISPQLFWQGKINLQNQRQTDALIYGLISLLILFNVYLFHQRLALLKTRRDLIRQWQVAERTARTDLVTGLYNRRFMQEAITREMARAERHQSELSIVFIDMDKFKDINTQFGHLVGDRALSDFASLLRKNFRSEDLVTRYAGDEFVVIMPETNSDQAEVAVRRLAQWIDRWNSKEQRPYRIAATCGVATYQRGMEVEQLLAAADAHLYAQKAPATVH